MGGLRGFGLMHIGLVLYGDIGTTTGGFRYDRKLVERLRDRGDEVEIISLSWHDTAQGLWEGLSRPLDRFDADFDLLLEDELAHPTLIGLNRRLRARRDVPIVAIVHHLRCSEDHPPWKTRLYRELERRYLAGVDAAVCNSDPTCETVTALADRPTTVAPPAGDRFDPAIDSAEIETRANEPGPLRVCFLGSLIPRKGLDTLVRGLSRLPDDRWRLTVVGHETDPAYAARIRHRVDDWGFDGVTFTGKLADDELAGVLRESHILAIPSTHEGFGIAYLEGMSFGLPALATTAGGARAVVDHGENGFLISPNDPAGIARAVRALDGDRARLARMGTAARKQYDRWPSWTESADDARAFLERVAGLTSESGGRHRVEA